MTKKITRTIPVTIIEFSLIVRNEDGTITAVDQTPVKATGTLTENEAISYIGHPCLINNLKYDNRKFSMSLRDFMEQAAAVVEGQTKPESEEQ